MRKLRAQIHHNKRDLGGVPSVGFGSRVGYWPCLRAPYVQIAFLFWRVDIWHGLASHLYFRS